MFLSTLVNIGLDISIFFNFDKSNLTILIGLKIGFLFFSFLTSYDNIVYDCVVKKLKILDIVLCFTAYSNRIIFNKCIVTILYKSTIICRIE